MHISSNWLFFVVYSYIQLLICAILSCPYVWFSLHTKNFKLFSKRLKASSWSQIVEGVFRRKCFRGVGVKKGWEPLAYGLKKKHPFPTAFVLIFVSVHQNTMGNVLSSEKPPSLRQGSIIQALTGHVQHNLKAKPRSMWNVFAGRTLDIPSLTQQRLNMLR